MKTLRGIGLAVCVLAGGLGCSDDGDDAASAESAETPVTDTSSPEGSADAGELDAGESDTGESDTGEPQGALDEEGRFVESFLWGAATAGFQVDMGCPSAADGCVDTASDWYQFATADETVSSGSTFLSGEDPAEVSPGHWELYEEDFDRLANELGGNAFRMSIEWSRIFPEATDDIEGFDALRAHANDDAVAHYHAVFAALKARGITPLVTLNHYVLPSWIHDGVGCHLDLDNCSPRGWLDRDRIIAEIAKFSGFVAAEYGAEVDWWITQNEPFALLLPGYLLPTQDRTNPPSVANRAAEAVEVIGALVYAHAAMYDAVVAADTTDATGDGAAAQVGLVYNLTPVAPTDPDNPLDVQAAENVFYLYNTLFMDAVALGVFDDDADGDGGEPRPELANRLDFVGLNYYTRIRVQGLDIAALPELSPLTTFNPLTVQLWEDYPEGIYEMLVYARDRYAMPIIVTENGVIVTEDETEQRTFLEEHIAEVQRAAADGVDVRGYLFWSLIDNFEWNHGSELKFGLYEVQADEARTRRARPAVERFAEIISNRGVDR